MNPDVFYRLTQGVFGVGLVLLVASLVLWRFEDPILRFLLARQEKERTRR